MDEQPWMNGEVQAATEMHYEARFEIENRGCMRLEFLPDGSDDCPLVRIYDFSIDEVAELIKGFHALASGDQDILEVSDLPGIDVVDGCRLVLRSGPRDRGMVQLHGCDEFECVLTTDGWKGVAEMADQLVEAKWGYQWLCSSEDASLLLSNDGHW